MASVEHQASDALMVPSILLLSYLEKQLYMRNFLHAACFDSQVET